MSGIPPRTHRFSKQYDVIVVGGGHAGCEAAWAASRMGRATLLLTISIDQIAHMSCNPAVGGMAKGHLVREIDALGGLMGQAIDATGIQFRRLNTSRGAAVRSSRAQADMYAYKTWVRERLECQDGLDIKQGLIESLVAEDGGGKWAMGGVRTQAGEEYNAPAVILATGTFLGGVVHIGGTSYPAGRAGEFAADALPMSLAGLGLSIGRLMTCTTPRLDAKTVDFSLLAPQGGDPVPRPFSFRTERIDRSQVPCWVTRTTEKTHRIIQANLSQSPMISGAMTGIPPRYCPSIEDKVRSFPDRLSHQLFLEPEGARTAEFYLNGFFTGLPVDVQIQALRTIPGLEEAQVMRPGYAIEYDFVHPTQLEPDLMVRAVRGLFLSGQINGTSGYEEAAAQGLMAGINASLFAGGEAPLVLGREQAYIGVMIDDLVTRGVTEPYRLFTSRAEHRLLLREDNADARLMETGHRLGLITEEEVEAMRAKARLVENGLRELDAFRVQADNGAKGISRGMTLKQVLRQPQMTYEDLGRFCPEFKPVPRRDAAEQIEIQAKYEGYISRQESAARRVRRLDSLPLPEDIDYRTLRSLSAEARERLSQVRPRSLGQASRIPGVTPAAISALMVYLKGKKGRGGDGGSGRGGERADAGKGRHGDEGKEK